MKNILMILLVILLGGGILAAVAGEHVVYMPIVYDDSPDPTATPKPTHTPTPVPAIGSWVYVGAVFADGGSTIVYGVKASYCADISAMKVVKTAWVSSELIPIGECDPSGWGGAWPPPVFDPPPSLPPEFGHGEAFKLVLPYNVKEACSVYYGESNCK